jgi:hypothetical protein
MAVNIHHHMWIFRGLLMRLPTLKTTKSPLIERVAGRGIELDAAPSGAWCAFR